MSIRLHIDSLLLEGLPLSPLERTRMERALVAELTQSFRATDSAHAVKEHGALPRLSAADIRVEAKEGGASIGSQIARSIFGSLVSQKAERFDETGSPVSNR